MVIKRNGVMRVYACTLVDDDPEYDLGGSLREAQTERILLRHHRCHTCFAFGSSCSELDILLQEPEQLDALNQLALQLLVVEFAGNYLAERHGARRFDRHLQDQLTLQRRIAA
jgi:hypothetical protein